MEVVYVLICHVISWMLFSATDYLSENGGTQDAMAVFLLGAVFLNLAAYILRDFRVRKGRAAHTKEMIFFSAAWLGVGGILGFLVCMLVFQNRWIVKQGVGGFENFLNGLEYPVFAVFLVLITWIFIILWNVCRWLYCRGRRH